MYYFICFTAFLAFHSTTAKDLPIADVDWRDSFMAPVRDIGSCGGAVVTFSILGALEWHVGKTTGEIIPLSAQYLVDCGVDEDTGQEINRCDGDFVASEIRQIMGDQYLPYEEDYKYLGYFKQGRCTEVGAKDKVLRNAMADVWLYDLLPLGQDPGAIRTALQTGPTVNTLNAGDIFGSPTNKILTDKECGRHPQPLALTFVGWHANEGDPYYVVRGSNGERVGEEGYFKYADNKDNENCGYTKEAYSVVVGRRRELEYKLGSGKLSFKESRRWCQNLGTGWDLAHVPTKMHNFEVYDLFTEKYGRDEKGDTSFNFFWVGLFNMKNGDNNNADRWVWVSGDWDDKTGTDIKYTRFTRAESYKFGVMKKVNPGNDSKRGRWATKPGIDKYRFVCSRYRAEVCPRISQTSVSNAYKVTFYSPEDGGETLEILDGALAIVTCMEGYKLKGGNGKCNGGDWSQLPSCSK